MVSLNKAYWKPNHEGTRWVAYTMNVHLWFGFFQQMRFPCVSLKKKLAGNQTTKHALGRIYNECVFAVWFFQQMPFQIVSLIKLIGKPRGHRQWIQLKTCRSCMFIRTYAQKYTIYVHNFQMLTLTYCRAMIRHRRAGMCPELPPNAIYASKMSVGVHAYTHVHQSRSTRTSLSLP